MKNWEATWDTYHVLSGHPRQAGVRDRDRDRDMKRGQGQGHETGAGTGT